jgi:ISXO2-like transposase domain
MMEDNSGLLKGIIEADETYVGGKRRRDTKSRRDKDDDQPRGRGGSRKAMVVTAVERGGKARAKRAKTHSERTIATFLFGHVSRESVLSTDELPAYRWIGRKFRAHRRVNHSAGEYVRTDPLAAAKARWAGSLRFLWNRLLEAEQAEYAISKKFLTKGDLQRNSGGLPFSVATTRAPRCAH